MNISELAKLAGVSSSAVSRYLNNGYLSEPKREAIRKAIEETGYRPLAHAQALRSRRTNTVGVIIPKINSFSVSNVMSGIDAELSQKGFQILLADTYNDSSKELEYIDLFQHQRVDGIILLATVLTQAHIAAVKNSSVPVVVVGQQLTGVPCVYHDDYQAFYDMTNLVLQKGCRSLGYIGAQPKDKAVGQERSRAYRTAVQEAGLPEQAEHIAIAKFTIASGYEKAQELMETFGPLDALICATDTIAAGALKYLKSKDIHVPQQIRLTGHGASDLCEVTTPTITTIRYFYEASGSNAASILLERMDKPDTPAKELKLGYNILEHESTQ